MNKTMSAQQQEQGPARGQGQKQCKFEQMGGCGDKTAAHRNRFIHLQEAIKRSTVSVQKCKYEGSSNGCTNYTEKHRIQFEHSCEVATETGTDGDKQTCPFEKKGCTNGNPSHREQYIHLNKVFCIFASKGRCSKTGDAEHIEAFAH